jgi:FG-GAP repeat
VTRRSVCLILLATGVAGPAAYGGSQARATARPAAAKSDGTAGWRQAAYVKASNPRASAEFGSSVALSADGRTLAVGSQMESSAATGINGNQDDHSAYGAGAVYVYGRGPQGWSEQAYVKASNTGQDDQFGFSVALSADGSTLAVSAPFEDSAATGINGNQADNSMLNSGAVYVFTRTRTSWSQQAYIKASNTGDPEEGDQFGYSVSLSADGNLLVVGAIGEDGAATTVNGDEKDNSAPNAGAAYVFSRSGGAWSQQAYLKAANAGRNSLFGYSVAVSGDGGTIAVGSFDEAGSARQINGPYDRRAAGTGAAYVFTLSGGTWAQQAYLKAKKGDPQDSMGCSIAISDAGNVVATGALDEDTMVGGINVVQSGHSGRVDAPDDNSSGAAYVFLRNGTTWTEHANFKASNVGKDDWFGIHLHVSGDGRTLAVGAPNERSPGQGINGTQENKGADQAGAVYLFERAGATWAQRVYFKGSNTRKFDEFGSAVALSRDGHTLAVGAHFESSGARGVNGNQADTSMAQSGAVYIFTR